MGLFTFQRLSDFPFLFIFFLFFPCTQRFTAVAAAQSHKTRRKALFVNNSTTIANYLPGICGTNTLFEDEFGASTW